MSERRACHVVRLHRKTCRYVSKRPEQEPLKHRIREIANTRVRYGYQRIHILLRREGWRINRKRVYRLYREMGLSLRMKVPKWRRSARQRLEREVPARKNHVWSMDFVSDALYDGRRFRALTIVDAYTRECLAIEVDQGIKGEQVAAVLQGIVAHRGAPSTIRVDNGPEFVSKALDAWAYQLGVTLDFSRPGKPTDNAYIESFNARFRAECLNTNWFLSLADAKAKIAAWREEYNQSHPHLSLGFRTPAEYARQLDILAST